MKRTGFLEAGSVSKKSATTIRDDFATYYIAGNPLSIKYDLCSILYCIFSNDLFLTTTFTIVAGAVIAIATVTIITTTLIVAIAATTSVRAMMCIKTFHRQP